MSNKKTLKQIRESKGIKQDEMAKRLQLSDRRCYSRKELGQVAFTNKEIVKIAKCFDLSDEEAYSVLVVNYVK